MNYICRVLDYMAWFWFMEWLILVYIINRIIHGRLEIWNLSSRVHIRYLTRSLRSLVRHRCEHPKINSISPRDHVLFSIYLLKYGNTGKKMHFSFESSLFWSSIRVHHQDRSRRKDVKVTLSINLDKILFALGHHLCQSFAVS